MLDKRVYPYKNTASTNYILLSIISNIEALPLNHKLLIIFIYYQFKKKQKQFNSSLAKKQKT